MNYYWTLGDGKYLLGICSIIVAEIVCYFLSTFNRISEEDIHSILFINDDDWQEFWIEFLTKRKCKSILFAIFCICSEGTCLFFYLILEQACGYERFSAFHSALIFAFFLDFLLFPMVSGLLLTILIINLS